MVFKGVLPCADCSRYNDGQGSRFCLVCPEITLSVKGIERGLREKLTGPLPSEAVRDYKIVLYEMKEIRRAQKARKDMNDLHRAILTLHLAEFRHHQIASLLSTTRQTVYQAIKVFK